MNYKIIRSIDDVKINSIDSSIVDVRNRVAGLYDRILWNKTLNCLKSGAIILVICSKPMLHRFTCFIEDIGFEIRDVIMWFYNSKDTELQPNFSGIIVARKPTNLSIVENIEQYSVGGINIDECRIPLENDYVYKETNRKSRDVDSVFSSENSGFDATKNKVAVADPKGRFPANVIFTYDDNDYDIVCGGFPYTKNSKRSPLNSKPTAYTNTYTPSQAIYTDDNTYGDEGSASRYFYCATRSRKDSDYNTPINLLQYLVRLVSPNNANILDIFMDTGEIGKAVMYENYEHNKNYTYIGIETDPLLSTSAASIYDYIEDMKPVVDTVKDNLQLKVEVKQVDKKQQRTLF